MPVVPTEPPSQTPTTPGIEVARARRRPPAIPGGPVLSRRSLLGTGVLAATGMSGLGLGISPARAAGVRASQTTLVLDSNENPLGLSPATLEAAREALASAHRYPDSLRERLVARIAEMHGVEPGQIVLGNGSTEVLQMAVQAASSPNKALILADPTFEAVTRYIRPFPYRTERVPLDPAFAHDIDRMRQVSGTHRRPCVVYICNPNNPTATLTPTADLESWIDEAPETTFFLVDEAYHEYVEDPGYRSLVSRARERPNVVVSRTFSKIYAMAGLRLGYAVTHPDTATRLKEFISGDNANAPALAAALASIDDRELIRRSRAANRAAMGVVHSCLDELSLDYLPSHANFLMHRIGGDLETYIQRMRDLDIRVGRPFPALPQYNRLSMGLPEEMARWTEAIRAINQNGWK
jgi:histidinol-phosphate aminotransferase